MLKPFRRSRQKACAALVAAPCQAAQASSFATAGRLSCLTDVQSGSALTRLYRFPRNERCDGRLLAEQTLRLVAPPAGRALLALDWTRRRGRFSVHSAPSRTGTRSVPVAVSACVKPRLARSRDPREETSLRLRVDRLRAAGVSVAWLRDRGSHRVKWLERLIESEQQFVARPARGVTVRLADRACLLKSSALGPGERRDYGRARPRSDELAGVRLIGAWVGGGARGAVAGDQPCECRLEGRRLLRQGGSPLRKSDKRSVLPSFY